MLAAGGVVTGRHLAASLALGAQGVWTGSIWLVAEEYGLNPKILRKLLAAGSEDTVIPPVETLFLASHLRERTRVTGLLSGLITHAEVDKSAAIGDVWALTRFWRGLMRY